MGKLVNKSELAEILGVTERTLTRWQDEPSSPLPIRERAKKRGQSHAYDTEECIEWVFERRTTPDTGEAAGVTQTEAERRKAVADAELKELKVAAERGRLVEADEVEAAYAKAFANVRARVRAVAPASAPDVARADDPAHVQDLLLAALDDALRDLSDGVIQEDAERSADPE